MNWIKRALIIVQTTPFLGLFLIYRILDATLTLIGQSSEYWSGNYTEAVEFNLPYLWLLKQSPLAFIGGVIAITGAAIFIIMRVNPRLRSAVFFLGFAAHFIGSASWLIEVPRYGWLLLVFLSLFSLWLLEREWPKFMAVVQSRA